MENSATLAASEARTGFLRRFPFWIAVLAVIATPACERRSGVEMAETQTASSPPAANVELTEGPNYAISYPALTMTTDATGQLAMSVTPRNGFKMNIEYPWLLTLTSPDALTIGRLEWDVAAMKRLTEDEALFVVPVAAGQAGQHHVDGHLRFSVCNDVRCDTPQAEVSWSVTIE